MRFLYLLSRALCAARRHGLLYDNMCRCGLRWVPDDEAIERFITEIEKGDGRGTT